MSSEAATESDAASTATSGTLSDQIRGVLALWARQGEHWETDRVAALHEQLHALSENAESERQIALSEAAFSAEVYLSSFVGLEQPMTPDQQAHFAELLKALEAEDPEQTVDGESAIDLSSDDMTDLSREESGGIEAETICVAGAVSEPLRQVLDLLREQGATLHADPELAETEDLLRRGAAAAVIADVERIPELESVIAVLEQADRSGGPRIPLIYVAARGDLETRIRAVRARGTGFFSPPFDAHDLRERIGRLIRESREQDPCRVLIVEDDRAQAEFAASILEKTGMETRSVTDPLSVIDQLRDFRPHLLLMDIYMPEVNGIELTSVIREYNEFSGIPIVFLSGEQDTDKQVDALSVGGDDFITKPIRPRQLIAVIRNRIRRARSVSGAGEHAAPRVPVLAHPRFLDRISAQLSADPMRSSAHAVLLLRIEADVAATDALTEAVIHAITGELGPNDTLGRLDDGRLAILAKRPDRNLVHDLAVRLHEAVADRSVEVGGEPVEVRLAIGIACAHGSGNESASMLARARVALDHADAREGRTVFHDEALEETLAGTDSGDSREEVEGDVAGVAREALDQDGFRLAFQPMLNVVGRGTETWELLPRLPMPDGELLEYADFRRDIEKGGLATRFDDWLLEHGLDLLHARLSEGRKIRLFVAQSCVSLLDPAYPQRVSEALRKRQMVGSGLVLEFRLSGLSHNLNLARDHIARLREMDIRISLSHFPEKPAAFKVLRYVHGNYIRIAPRLLRADRETITAMIEQAHRAGARVVVSQIDDPRAIDLHWSAGADLLQGDFIQQPLDEMEYDFTQVVI